jgi:hypothetical protein
MKKKETTMKPEPKVRKLTLKKETLRDLTADHAGNVRGGAKGGNGNTKKCPPSYDTCIGGCWHPPV